MVPCCDAQVSEHYGVRGDILEEKEIWERIATAESSIKSAHHRLDRIEHLADSIHSLASEMREMRNDFANVIGRVDEIEDKPKKRYELVVTSGLAAFVSGVAGYILSMVLK